MDDEIKETLSYLTKTGTDADKQKAYDVYVKSADDKELKDIEKLLHRTAFVGSKAFCKEIKNGTSGVI